MSPEIKVETAKVGDGVEKTTITLDFKSDVRKKGEALFPAFDAAVQLACATAYHTTIDDMQRRHRDTVDDLHRRMAVLVAEKAELQADAATMECGLAAIARWPGNDTDWTNAMRYEARQTLYLVRATLFNDGKPWPKP